MVTLKVRHFDLHDDDETEDHAENKKQMIIWRAVLINTIIMAYLNKLIPKSNLKGPISQFVKTERSFCSKWVSDRESRNASNELRVRGTRGERRKKISA